MSSKSETVGSEFDRADRLKVVWIESAKRLMRDIGVTMNMKLPDDKTYFPQVADRVCA